MRPVKFECLEDWSERSYKKGDLIESWTAYASQVHKLRYPQLNRQFIFGVVSIVEGGVKQEWEKLLREIRAQGLREISIELSKQLPARLEELGGLRTLAPSDRQYDLAKSSYDYRELMILYGHDLTPVFQQKPSGLSVEEYYAFAVGNLIKRFGGNESIFAEENKENLKQITSEIFDDVKRATERSLKGELSKEEEALYHSTEPRHKILKPGLKADLMRFANYKAEEARQAEHPAKKVRLSDDSADLDSSDASVKGESPSSVSEGAWVQKTGTASAQQLKFALESSSSVVGGGHAERLLKLSDEDRKVIDEASQILARNR